MSEWLKLDASKASVLERVPQVRILLLPRDFGEVRERFKRRAWRACVPKGTQGSNPCLSAINFTHHNSSHINKL